MIGIRILVEKSDGVAKIDSSDRWAVRCAVVGLSSQRGPAFNEIYHASGGQGARGHRDMKLTMKTGRGGEIRTRDLYVRT